MISVALELQLDLLDEILSEQLQAKTLKLISSENDNPRGLVRVGKYVGKTSQVSPLKRSVSKVSQDPKTRIPPKQAKPKPSPVPNSGNQNSASDYAVLSAAASKVDTSTLISVVQNLKTNEKEFRCSFCQYVSKNSANTKRHIDLNHVNSGVVLQCKTCGKTSKLKANLKAHYMKAHSMSAEAANCML